MEFSRPKLTANEESQRKSSVFRCLFNEFKFDALHNSPDQLKTCQVASEQQNQRESDNESEKNFLKHASGWPEKQLGSQTSSYKEKEDKEKLSEMFEDDQNTQPSSDQNDGNSVHLQEKPFNCEYCSMSFNAQSFLKAHQISGRQQDVLMCLMCGKNFPAKCSLKAYRLADHREAKLRQPHRSEATSLESPSCETSFATNLCVNDHMSEEEKPTEMFEDNQNAQPSSDQSDTDSNKIVHLPLRLPEKSFNCEYCSKMFSTQGFLKAHQVGGRQKDALKCLTCGKSFLAKCILKAHRLTEHREIKVCQPRQSEATQFECPSCDTSFATKLGLRDHILSEHQGAQPYSCDVCGKCFRNKSGLMSHRRVHNADRPHVCEDCGKSFATKNTFNAHRKVHGEKAFVCETCGRRFSLAANLSRHHQSHKEVKSFSCEVCGKNFAQVGHLHVHQRLHVAQNAFVCDVCGKSFRHFRSLQVHSKVHNSERPFPCSVCGRTFRSLAYLKKHEKLHSGEKLHTCQECGRTFGSEVHLRLHLRSHPNLSAFTCKECRLTCADLSLHQCRQQSTRNPELRCSVCDKRFLNKKSLDVHMRIHNGEKPYSCNECGKSFPYLTSLLRHASVHTGKKTFACTKCGKCFATSFSLRVHTQRHSDQKEVIECPECGKRFLRGKVPKNHKCGKRTKTSNRKGLQKLFLDVRPEQ